MNTPNPLLLFWRQYLRRPLRVGGIAPSSGHLARAMVRTLAARPGDVVVELGPGTGVFTREILRQGIAPKNLVLVEFDRHSAVHLKRAHRGVKVIRGDARELQTLLRQKGHAHVPRIMSGLPLRSMPPRLRRDITQAMGLALEPGGSIVQFTYFKAPPLDEDIAEAMGLEVVATKAVMANLPPAFVWHYKKRLNA